MSARLRFAPSPTGNIHVGNLRTALFNWLSALRQNGVFLLRFDDTDAERSRSAYADAIRRDLEWIGIVPTEVYRQSERMDLYESAASRLRESGRLYACFETPEELDAKRARQRRRGLPPVYDRAALALTESERRGLIDAGRRPHWRFLLAENAEKGRRVGWEDRFRGEQSVDLDSLSDPVLIREDGTFLYTLPSVVDDIDLGITEIIRGEDHTTNTAVQIALFEALDASPPAFGHHNLLTAVGGEGLSKRSGARSIAGLRDDGFEPMAVATLAALVGTSLPIEPVETMAELSERFASASVSRAPAQFDEAELAGLNARFIHETPFAAVSERLDGLGIAGDEAFWLAVRGNCTVLADAKAWWQIVSGSVETTPIEDERLAEAAIALLPEEPWDGETFKGWTASIKEATGIGGRALFKPLRLALTGRDHGPEMAALLPLIGRRDTLARLAASRHRPPSP